MTTRPHPQKCNASRSAFAKQVIDVDVDDEGLQQAIEASRMQAHHACTHVHARTHMHTCKHARARALRVYSPPQEVAVCHACLFLSNSTHAFHAHRHACKNPGMHSRAKAPNWESEDPGNRGAFKPAPNRDAVHLAPHPHRGATLQSPHPGPYQEPTQKNLERTNSRRTAAPTT